ncbi:MAG: 16S rRNA (uracil(1498)-N(3))-methyltransferase [Acidimicrobiales bacterium]|nr:16S rRNA (uracil(1498)-N(3))-methyltransferase [Acidimicrobiales bacterium]
MAPVPSDGGPLAYVDDLDAPRLDDEEHHHLARVRRLRAGDALVLSDGRGGWRPACFAGTEPEPTGEVQHEARPTPELAVAFALVKGAKPELVVQKLTELGIEQIVPFVAERSVVRWDRSKVAAAQVRLTKVARGAAAQSRRAFLPVVEPVADFASVAARPGAGLADRDGAPPSLDLPLLLVGPEGGWSPAERDVPLPTVGLAPGVLRAETAAIVAASVLVALRSGVVAPAAGT